MKRELHPLPRWTTTALQGLVFWIGYKRSLYRDYPLSEGALVTELRSLIHANLSDELFLHCEVAYSKLAGKGAIRPEIIAGSVRADLVVATASESTKTAGKTIYSPHVVMEFKRARAPAAQITKDLQRLAAFAALRPEARAFLLVLSESDRHDRFVTAEGSSQKGEHAIPGTTGAFRVRRTLKAAHAYTNKGSANYASIVEVYPSAA
jgi:hypothetical protein